MRLPLQYHQTFPDYTIVFDHPVYCDQGVRGFNLMTVPRDQGHDPLYSLSVYSHILRLVLVYTSLHIPAYPWYKKGGEKGDCATESCAYTFAVYSNFMRITVAMYSHFNK